MASASRLPDRAVHVFFLRKLEKEKVPGTSDVLGDLKTFKVVTDYVRPATAKSKANFVDGLCQRALAPKYQPAWCSGGVLEDVEGKPQAFGPTDYFVSHAWSYKFSGLLALIDRHYASLPATDGGKVFAPVYYWVDILAVTQHFSGDFKDHPDSDFPGVIRASKSVLFTMYPWRAPIAPTRVWCLFEALMAVLTEGVELEVLLDTQNSADTGLQTVLAVAAGVDVRSSQASVAADKAFIMGRIRDGLGIDGFNTALRTRLKEALTSAAVQRAGLEGNTDGVMNLIKAGGWRGANNALDLPDILPYGTTANVVTVLDLCTAASGMPRRLVLSRLGTSDEDARKGKTRKGTTLWRYLPITGSILASVGRLLQRQPSAVGGGGAQPSTPNRQSGLQELWLELAAAVDIVKPYETHAPDVHSTHEQTLAEIALEKEPEWHKKIAQLRKKYPTYHEQKAPVLEVVQAELVRRADAAIARATADLPARLKDRSELWSGLLANTTLTVLGLHGGTLNVGLDTDELARALRQNRSLRELQVVRVAVDDVRGSGAAGSGPLTRAVLAAALGSRSLERLVIVPRKLAFLESLDVPAAAAWGEVVGGSLKELVISPIALGAKAAKQLGELLAAAPALTAGCVEVHRCGQRGALQKLNPADPPKGEPPIELAPFLQLLARVAPAAGDGSGSPTSAASPRAAALTHIVCMGTCFIAARHATDWRWQAEEGVAEASPRTESLQKVLLARSLQAAPPEYQAGWMDLCPVRTPDFKMHWRSTWAFRVDKDVEAEAAAAEAEASGAKPASAPAAAAPAAAAPAASAPAASEWRPAVYHKYSDSDSEDEG